MSAGIVGIDLDGTLAEDLPGVEFDPNVIGPPVPKMIERARWHMDRGEEVQIFTARASDSHRMSQKAFAKIINTIRDWTEEHVGARLPVTAEKSYRTKLYYDDRARQVIRNEGIIVGCENCMKVGR